MGISSCSTRESELLSGHVDPYKHILTLCTESNSDLSIVHEVQVHTYLLITLVYTKTMSLGKYA